MHVRWYRSQLECLPPGSQRELASQLQRCVRARRLPSRRDWRLTVRRALARYELV